MLFFDRVKRFFTCIFVIGSGGDNLTYLEMISIFIVSSDVTKSVKW
jgi:hypothetical protein